MPDGQVAGCLLARIALPVAPFDQEDTRPRPLQHGEYSEQLAAAVFRMASGDLKGEEALAAAGRLDGMMKVIKLRHSRTSRQRFKDGMALMLEENVGKLH